MIVKNNKPRVISLGGHVSLNPGNNTVDDALWLRAMHKPTVVTAAMMNEKHLEVVQAPSKEAVAAHQEFLKTGVRPLKLEDVMTGKSATPATGSGKTGNAALPADTEAAKDLIADTFDRDTLNAWKASEKRQELVSAIDDQLELTKVDENKDVAAIPQGTPVTGPTIGKSSKSK